MLVSSAAWRLNCRVRDANTGGTWRCRSIVFERSLTTEIVTPRLSKSADCLVVRVAHCSGYCSGSAAIRAYQADHTAGWLVDLIGT
jgi:hypothetical protein